ncbi:MAG: hypothetical protein ACRYGP_05805 [Janthinobacterium lividum]
MPVPAPNAPKAETAPATAETPNPMADPSPQNEPNQGAMTLKTSDAISVSGKGKFKIAPGRSLLHATIVENDGVKTARNKGYNPGDEIELDAEEAESLIKMGFLLDTDGSVVVRADGPAVNVENGVQIAQPA